VYSNEKGSGYQPKLTINYRNQSKIKNTGSTNISGYLLIQVQYNNSGNWTVDNDTVNETTPRTINSSDQLALDKIFNGLVNTNDLTHGNGTYRVYAAFRDDDGNILQCDDDTYLVAYWEFTVTFS
jgi:phage-related protein